MEKRWYKWYDKQVPHSIYYPPMPLKDFFNYHAEKNPDKPYLIINDITLPYGLCNVLARRFANALLKMGIKKGDRLAIMAPNVPQYILAEQACFKIGVIVVPVNPLATVPEITHQLNDSGAETIVVMAAFAKGPIEILKAKTSPLKHVITFQIKSIQIDVEKGNGIYDMDALVAESSDEEPDVKVTWDDTALLQYTGGTTGVSKGCKLSNFNLVSIAYQDVCWFTPLFKPGELRTLAAIPVYHIFGFNCNINVNLVNGGTIILVPQPTTENILEAINKHEPNFFAAVPTMIIGLNQHPDTPKSKIRSIRGMISGSSPLAVEAMKKFEELSGATIIEGYGLSETSNVLTCNPIFTKRKPGSVGLPWPDNDIKIVDLDTGTKEMPIGEAGELIAKGPTIMSEYWQNEKETAIALRDGWLYTGDIAYMDEDGYIFIVDRKKDMILSSGFNVYPREIDEVMYTHPKVLRACAVGIPDEKRGESVKLFIVTKPGETMTEEEAIEYCRDRLSPYKVPKCVEFIDELPLTAIGKPDRKVLKQRELEKLKR
ncbi:MAG: long-chain fatty acid--CoA ligase [Spirochaetota bacterium]